MRRRVSLAVGLLACAAAPGTTPAYAQVAPNGPYVSLGGGVGLQQNLTREPNAALLLPDRSDVSFNPGPAGEIGLGWAFGNGLRIDLDAPILRNRVSGASQAGEMSRAGGSELKYGGMVNLMYDFHVGLAVTPYLGIGAGGLAIEHDGFYPPRSLSAGAGSQVNSDFAYQGIVGLAYPVDFAPGLAMTAEYRVLGLLDPQPGFRTSVANTNGDAMAGENVRLSNDVSHSLILGLRYAFAQPREAMAVPAAAALATTPPGAGSVRTYLVFFDWDRAELSARARQIVAEAADGWRRVQTTRIDVSGYTDMSGSAEYNKRLSARRAENVAAELVRDGVAADDVVTFGLGEASPLVATGLGRREAQNRRVEIVLH